MALWQVHLVVYIKASLRAIVLSLLQPRAIALVLWAAREMKLGTDTNNNKNGGDD